MPSELRWVIVSTDGLYVGQWLTRSAAIAQHVSEILDGSAEFPRLSGFVVGGKLDKDQRRAWETLRALGDRVTRATISWDEPPQERE